MPPPSGWGSPIGIHAGSDYHNPPTSVGWGSYHIEDYVAQAQAFQTQLTSLIIEGVFARHPNLKMVMLESGFTWLPAYLWRLHKVLARHPHGGAVGGSRATRNCAQQHPLLAAADRCPGGSPRH